MRRTVIAVSAAVVLALFGVAPGHAEKRMALVVGNDLYNNLPADQQLRRAANDARAVGDALDRLGFEVLRGENLGRQALVEKLDELTRRLSPGDTAFFFFAGHGVSMRGGNYILPTDVPNVQPGQETLLARTSLGESDIVSDLQGRGVRVAVVVLDACRNNPFKRPDTQAIGGERGCVRSDPVQGVFSIYSAGIGQTALDQLGEADNNPNSVFTRVLVPALRRPELDLGGLAIEVREEVARLAGTIGHTQHPAYYDGTIGGRIYLAGLPPAAPRVEGPPDLNNFITDPRAADPSQAELAWAVTKDTTAIAVLEEFVRRYGDSRYAALARARMEELRKSPATALTPPGQTAPPPSAPTTHTPIDLAPVRVKTIPMLYGEERSATSVPLPAPRVTAPQPSARSVAPLISPPPPFANEPKEVKTLTVRHDADCAAMPARTPAAKAAGGGVQSRTARRSADDLPLHSACTLHAPVVLSEAECRALPRAAFVRVEGRDFCVRYWISTAGGTKGEALVFIHGDLGSGRIGEFGKLNSFSARVTAGLMQRSAHSRSRIFGGPYFAIGRLGAYGSSGDHRDRKRPIEIKVMMAALDALKAEYAVRRFHLVGQSGGGHTVAALLQMRQDIGCAVMTSGAISNRTLNRDRGLPVTAHILESYDPIDHAGVMRDRPGQRIVVMSDPDDRFVSFRSQREFVQRVRSAGLPILHISAAASDKDSHGLETEGIRLASDCAKGVNDAALVARYQTKTPPSAPKVTNSERPAADEALTSRIPRPGSPSPSKPTPAPRKVEPRELDRKTAEPRRAQVEQAKPRGSVGRCFALGGQRFCE